MVDFVNPPTGTRKVMVANPQFRLPARPRAVFLSLLSRTPSREPHDILLFLLTEGFEVGSTNTVSNASLTLEGGEHKFGEYFGMRCAMYAPTPSNPRTKAIVAGKRFAYRGDSRDPSTVVAHNGATCRSDLDFWRKSSGIDEEWHPWKKASKLSDHMWIRKGNEDNDYFTVNSIAMDFHIACAYPIFRSGDVGKQFHGDVNEWSDDERMKFRSMGQKLPSKPNFCEIRRRGGTGTEYALTDLSRIYVCLVDDNDMISETYNAGANYPEAGIRNMPLTSMLACFRLRRVHVPPPNVGSQRSDQLYDSTQRQGVAMTCEVLDWQWVNGPNCGRTSAGLTANGVNLLERRFNDLAQQPFDITHTSFVGSGGGNTYFQMWSFKIEWSVRPSASAVLTAR